MAWNFFKRKKQEQKESATAKIIYSQDKTGTIWPTRNYDNFARETYLKNVTAFAAIKYVAQSVASVSWSQFRQLPDGKGRDVVTDDDISRILKRSNPTDGFSWTILRTIAFLQISGNAFLESVGPTSGPNNGKIKELYSLRPDRFNIIISNGRISGYEYKLGGNGKTFEVDQITGKSHILHLKTFHPLDDFWGAAPTESGAREIDTENAATNWNKALLDNQGRPGMIYTLIGDLGAQQIDDLERYLRENHGGPENAGKDLILTGERGTGVTPYGWSPTDMDFSDGDLRLMRKIAMTYGVPPMLLGIPGEATFANYSEARLAFWEDTVFWWLNYLKSEINNWMYELDSDLFIDYILDDIPALSIKRDKLWDRAEKADFASINEKRKMVGLDDWGDTGNVILIDASKIPLGMETETQIEEETEEEEKVKKFLETQGFSETEINSFLNGDYTNQ